MAIIHLQRRLVQVGRIRMGQKNDRGLPTRLDTWRLTSRDSKRLDAAAQVFGGTVQPWEGRQGEYELVTEASDLPIMLLPGQTLTQWMEAWSGGECVRRCDGDTETITDGPCLCDPDKRECKPHSRLNIMLPDVPGLGMWRLDTTGWNAAQELAGTAELLESATARGVLLPARLRIDQRVEVRDGQTKRFGVPVLDIDIRSLDAMQIAAGITPQAQLEPGYKPVAQLPAAGVTVEEGLAGAEASGKPRSSSGREAAPIPQSDVPFGDDEPVPVPVPNEDGSTTTTLAVSKPTQAQLKKLNVLVGKLRDAGQITTEHLWAALAKERHVDVDTMIELLAGRDEAGLHWSPLRDSLTKTEASGLIDRLEKLA